MPVRWCAVWCGRVKILRSFVRKTVSAPEKLFFAFLHDSKSRQCRREATGGHRRRQKRNNCVSRKIREHVGGATA